MHSGRLKSCAFRSAEAAYTLGTSKMQRTHVAGSFIGSLNQSFWQHLLFFLATLKALQVNHTSEDIAREAITPTSKLRL